MLSGESEGENLRAESQCSVASGEECEMARKFMEGFVDARVRRLLNVFSATGGMC